MAPADINPQNWLASIADETNIGALSIPGTHNSAACYKGLPSVRCQDTSVLDQLENGVRFLDIRVGKYLFKSDEDANELTVVHGKYPVRIPVPKKFAKVLDEVYSFLEKYSSETVVMSIKQEGTGNWNSDNDEFANLFWDRYIEPQKGRWYLNPELPLLGEARGKIVLFRRFSVRDDDRRARYGLEASSWRYNTPEHEVGDLVVQDFCEISGIHEIPLKVEHIRSLAEKAAEHNALGGQSKLFVNFTSASNFFEMDCWPEKVAKAVYQLNLQVSFRKAVGW